MKNEDKVRISILGLLGSIVFGFISPVLVLSKSTLLVLVGLGIIGAYFYALYLYVYPTLIDYVKEDDPDIQTSSDVGHETTRAAPNRERSVTESNRGRSETMPDVDVKDTMRRRLDEASIAAARSDEASRAAAKSKRTPRHQDIFLADGDDKPHTLK